MISIQEMKELEKGSGIAPITLMENAGRGVSVFLKEKFPDLKDKKILIVCYHGNNGGDGFVVANQLSEISEVDVFFIGDEDKMGDETKENYTKVENNVLIQLFHNLDMIQFEDYDIIIDAILGTGSKGVLKEPIKAIVDMINQLESYKVSIDVPTGVDPDTGFKSEISIIPDVLLTFHDIKKGLFDYKDITEIIDIGLNK